MRVRHSFSSRHTGKLQNIRKQKGKYPLIAKKIIENSDIILEILDARFPQETRNIQFEEEIKQKGKKIIYVLNKSDLIINKKPDILKELFPYALVSVTSRKGIKDLYRYYLSQSLSFYPNKTCNTTNAPININPN